METALKLIISKTDNENLARQALACLRALSANSPVVQQRYQQLLQYALYHEWTPEERAILVAPLEATPETNRDYILRVRLTQDERATLEQAAEQDGLTMSEYIRRKIF